VRILRQQQKDLPCIWTALLSRVISFSHQPRAEEIAARKAAEPLTPTETPPLLENDRFPATIPQAEWGKIIGFVALYAARLAYSSKLRANKFGMPWAVLLNSLRS